MTPAVNVRQTMNDHGLWAWNYHFEPQKYWLGETRHAQREIAFADHLLKLPAHIQQDTVLHEIAHALVGPGHGPAPP
jgi:hypothetical protein